jgi:uncharacterized protein with HEPN domain
MQRPDELCVLDMLLAARITRDLVRGITYEQFEQDIRTQSAVLWQIALIGEAASKVSDIYKQNHSEVPWRDVSDMRNRLIHGYMRINFPKVWTTSQVDIPELIHLIEPLVPPEE